MSSPLLSCVTSEGGLLPPEVLHRILAQDRSLPGLTPVDYHLNVRLGEAASRAWSALQLSWRAFRTQLERLPVDDTGTTVTREKWLLPLFRELGFGWLATKAGLFTVGSETYPFSHGYGHVPMHLLGARVSLDKKERGLAGAARMSPHGLVQQFLNRSDAHLWGLVSNGLTVRLLRDHYSLSTAAYLEFDLEAMFDGGFYSEFLLLFLVLHQSRFEAEKTADIWIEKWFKEAQREGVAALDRLGAGAEAALVQLGTGFLVHPENSNLRDALKHGRLGRDAYFRELLRLLYRVLFLFVAEDRQALLIPDAPADRKERFTLYYGTRRLRELAFRARGTAHHDVWEQLRLLFACLWEGEPLLALPALGSGLFDPRQLAHLSEAKLSNAHLLSAIRALAEVVDGGRRIRVSYRNLGAQELGSVYESLLELHPTLNVDAGKFELASAAGNERKTTGSYYTHISLVESLLDAVLDPVIDDAVIGRTMVDAEKALLALKVCDPACGSGHFLVAAARRIADRLARVRTPDEEPSPGQRQHALRDVVGHCLFGVDVNPMAVELCKVSLWMEAIEAGRPLNFLDAHIQCGNALFGATPALLKRGIPDEAFDPIEGDDPATASALRKQNKKERTELALDFTQAPSSVYARLSDGARAVDSAADDDLVGVRAKEERWQSLLHSPGYDHARFVADLWCAAFAWQKDPVAREVVPTEATYRAISNDATRVSIRMRDAVSQLSKEYGFFHWHLAFPQVFRPIQGPAQTGDPYGWTGGFDAVIGNPPWDSLSPDLKEFFAVFNPDVRAVSPGEQGIIVESVLQDQHVASLWSRYRRRLLTLGHFLRDSGRFKLFASGNLGKGDFNIYRMFVELAAQVTREAGGFGQVVPENLYNGANATEIRRFLFHDCCLVRLLGFENTRKYWFSAIHASAKFCLYGARRCGTTLSFEAAFRIRTSEALEGATADGLVRIPVSLVAEFAPDALSVMEFSSQKDIDVATGMYARCPKLGDTAAGPPLREYLYELDLGENDDRALLNEEASGLPLYEGRMVGRYDHRAKAYVSGRGRQAQWDAIAFEDPRKAICPQWHVRRDEIPSRARSRIASYRIGFCDVASPSNERTLVAAILPPYSIAGHTVPTLVFRPGDDAYMCCWLAVANSMCLDFLARQKATLHMTFTILDSLPFPRSFSEALKRELVPLVIQLSCASPEMRPLGEAMAKSVGGNRDYAPLVNKSARSGALARIEAIVAWSLFRLSRDELAHVAESFPIVKKRDLVEYGDYRTKQQILECYDALRKTETSLEVSVRPVSSELALLPDGAWARPRSEPRYEAIAALAAILKSVQRPIPASEVRLAATLVLEPRWLVPYLDAEAASQWCRLVGPDADPAPAGVRMLVPATDPSWGAALSHLRGSGRLIEDTDLFTWAAGSGLENIETTGWPEERSRLVMDAIQRHGVGAVVAALPEELRRSINASAA